MTYFNHLTVYKIILYAITFVLIFISLINNLITSFKGILLALFYLFHIIVNYYLEKKEKSTHKFNYIIEILLALLLLFLMLKEIPVSM